MNETKNTVEQAERPGTPMEARLRAIVEEVIADHDLFLVALEVRGRKGSQAIDVFLDSDGPLDVDALAEVSREVGFVLDVEDVVKGRYHLNVSSPGADRPLLRPGQYRKNVGRVLEVTYRPAGPEADVEAGPLTAKGELTAADDAGITLAVSKKETLDLTYGDIETARVQLPW